MTYFRLLKLINKAELISEVNYDALHGVSVSFYHRDKRLIKVIKVVFGSRHSDSLLVFYRLP